MLELTCFVLSSEAGEVLSKLRVEKLLDRDRIYDYLATDRVAHAYQIGDLDEVHFGQSSWFGCLDEQGEIEAVLLIYDGLSLPVVFSSGTKGGTQTLFKNCTLPARFQFQVWEEHRGALEGVHRPTDCNSMARMALTREAFEPRATPVPVVGLGHRDTADIIKLYAHYPDNLFEPYQLGSGLYFGVREDERLVSIAGIHVLNEKYDLAAIGNLVTDPRCQGKGYASACTTRLLEALFERVSLVTLNAQVENAAAMRTFERLGFQKHLLYFEGRVGL